MGWVHELIHVNLIADFFDLIVNNISLLSIGTIWQENPRHYFKHNIGIYILSARLPGPFSNGKSNLSRKLKFSNSHLKLF